MMRRQPRLRQVLLAILTTTFVLLGAEVLLSELFVSPYSRALYPGDIVPQPDLTWDEHTGWKLPPDGELRETMKDYSVVYHGDKRGFRGNARGTDPPPSRLRIVIAGDSFTFGIGVEDSQTFSALIEERHPGAWTYNLGISAFGIDQMWRALLSYGYTLEPDIVIVAFIPRDLGRSLTAYRKDHIWREKPVFRLRDGRLEEMTEENRPGVIRSYFLQRSALFGYWLRIEGSLSRRWPIGYRWRLNRRLFERIRNDTEKRGARLLVVHIPNKRLHSYPLFERAFARMGVDFLDLQPLLPENAEALYFTNDEHLTPQGHAFVADHVARFLRLGEVVE